MKLYVFCIFSGNLRNSELLITKTESGVICSQRRVALGGHNKEYEYQLNVI